MTTNASPSAVDRRVDFPPCPVCASESWATVYHGKIRDGVFGKWRDSEVRVCGGCELERVAESACLGTDAYETAEYRDRIGQDRDVGRYLETHDELARFTLEAVWPLSLRDKTVADIGCAGGGLLDHLRGVAGRLVAVEPAIPYSRSLQERGYDWFGSVGEAARSYAGKVDVAFSVQVIEHVADPRLFLEEIGGLLSPDGIAVISTPNRRDILMDLLPDDFPKFFYRVQHRWAFDASSLSKCAIAAGLTVAGVKHIHRYGLANAMHWLRTSEPRGRKALPPLDATIDKHWQAWLEANGRTDNLYMVLRKSSDGMPAS